MKIKSENPERVVRPRRIKGTVQDTSALYRDVQFTPAMPLRKLEQMIADFIRDYKNQGSITHITDRPKRC